MKTAREKATTLIRGVPYFSRNDMQIPSTEYVSSHYHRIFRNHLNKGRYLSNYTCTHGLPFCIFICTHTIEDGNKAKTIVHLEPSRSSFSREHSKSCPLRLNGTLKRMEVIGYDFDLTPDLKVVLGLMAEFRKIVLPEIAEVLTDDFVKLVWEETKIRDL